MTAKALTCERGYAPARTAPLRVYRASFNLSQEALAGLTGLRPETISRIECGHHAPSRRTVKAISEALRVPADALFPPEDSV